MPQTFLNIQSEVIMIIVFHLEFSIPEETEYEEVHAALGGSSEICLDCDEDVFEKNGRYFIRCQAIVPRGYDDADGGELRNAIESIGGFDISIDERFANQF